MRTLRLSNTEHTLLLSAIVLLITPFFAGCFHTILAYKGDQLPDNEVGILYVFSKGINLEVTSIDGTIPDLEVNEFVDQRDCQIHFQPGNHEITVTRRTGWGGNSGYKKITMSFTVAAGHVYDLDIEEGARIGNLVEIVPYVRDRAGNVHVSVVVRSER